LQEADGFDAAENYGDVEEPEEEEAGGGALREVLPAGDEGDEHGVDGFAADPGLNAEPAAGYQGAEDGWDVGAEDAERGAGENGEGNAVLRAGVGVEDHGDKDENVAEENGEERLLPVHAAGDHAAGEEVGGDIDAHGDPQGGVAVGGPGAAGWLDGG